MKYKTIVADPPWPMKWTGGAATRTNGYGRTYVNANAGQRELEYPTLELSAIEALPVRSLCDEEGAHLFLWTTEIHLLSGAASRVVAAWGFSRPRTLIWRKNGFGLGTFPRPQHETCLVAVRGKARFSSRKTGSVQDWNVVFEGWGKRRHSAKPDGFLDLVEQVSPGPYLEMFSRRARLGWDTHGNESLGHVELAS